MASDPRVFFASERTLLAWVRTGIAIVGLGFLVSRFGLFLRLVAAQGGNANGGSTTAGAANGGPATGGPVTSGNTSAKPAGQGQNNSGADGVNGNLRVLCAVE